MEELQRITERLKALTGGKPAFNHFDALRSGTPKGSTIPNITDPVQREIASQVQRMQRLGAGNAAAPGTQATKTVLNSPRGTRFGVRGLAGGLNAAALGGQLLEEGLAGMDNEYGRKVAGARDQRENSLDALAGMGIGGVFNSAFREPSPKMGSLDGKRSVANMGGVSYDLSTPEGERGFSNARKDALKVQTDKGVMPGQLPSDYKETEAAAFSAAAGPATGTDTGSGDRESLRAAGGDPAMVAWAKANPELAARMVDKVDDRRNRGLEGKQSGYEAVRNELYPERAVLASEGNLGGFSVDDAVDGGMSSKEAEAIGSGGFVETVFDKGVQGESKITNNSAEKATDLLNNYKAQLSGNLEPFAETVIPSQSQNPVTFGGDGTPIDSETQLGKVIPDFTGKMDGLNKNISNRFRAF